MGKKNKHSKDKLHKTVSELKSHHLGADRDLELSVIHRRLRYDTCCITLNSIEGKHMGLSDDDGFCYVFDCDTIVEFLNKFQVHPITGAKVTAKHLIELKYHKNNEDRYHCPVIYKLFNSHSKIVVNRKSGHVYSYDAYHQLNLKPKNFKDLLTDEPFDKNDILFIQDPDRAEEKWTVSNFHYVKNKLRLDDESANSSNVRDIDRSSILKSSLEEYKKKAVEIAQTYNKIVGHGTDLNTGDEKIVLDKINSATYSDGSLAKSVTSTVMPVLNKQNAAVLNEEQILYPRIKKKGYVQMMTNMGPINLELYCDRTPKTCHNFMLLAGRGYYDNTIFHRLVKNFILQGGDPTGTGSGGQSAWGEPFRDECHGDLKHVGGGVLSMANSGPNTNKSQFYITLKGSWDHLDGKHTVFGRVVGGADTLARIESIKTDKSDKPLEEIKIVRIVKYCDPFEEAERAIELARKQDKQLVEEQQQEAVGRQRVGKSTSGGGSTDGRLAEQPLKRFRTGIGSYINLEALNKSTATRTARSVAGKPDMANNGNNRTTTATMTTTTVAATATDNAPERPDEPAPTEASLSSELARVAPQRPQQAGGQSYGDFSNW